MMASLLVLKLLYYRNAVKMYKKHVYANMKMKMGENIL